MRGQVQECNPKGGRGAWAILRMCAMPLPSGEAKVLLQYRLVGRPKRAEANVILGLFKPILDAFQHQHHLQDAIETCLVSKPPSGTPF